jgi:hypothetical protein
MLDAYDPVELQDEAHEAPRKHIRCALKLAVGLQHKRTATFRDAAMCVEGHHRSGKHCRNNFRKEGSAVACQEVATQVMNAGTQLSTGNGRRFRLVPSDFKRCRPIRALGALPSPAPLLKGWLLCPFRPQ